MQQIKKRCRKQKKISHMYHLTSSWYNHLYLLHQCNWFQECMLLLRDYGAILCCIMHISQQPLCLFSSFFIVTCVMMYGMYLYYASHIHCVFDLPMCFVQVPVIWLLFDLLEKHTYTNMKNIACNLYSDTAVLAGSFAFVNYVFWFFIVFYLTLWSLAKLTVSPLFHIFRFCYFIFNRFFFVCDWLDLLILSQFFVWKWK